MDAVRKTDRSAARAATVATLRLTARAKAAIHREALDFVCERYALEESQRDALAAIPIRWRRGRGASAYYPRRAHGFAGPHILLRVAPGASARWHTYRRARARFTTPPGGIELATRTLAAAVLVHELTHALQHGAAGGDRRRFSEVETTGNEIEFVRRRAPEAFAQLQPVVRKARRRPGRKAAAKPASGLAALRAIVLRAAGRIAGLVSPSRAPRRPTTRPRSRSPRPTGS
jgi:hypothetical protein